MFLIDCSSGDGQQLRYPVRFTTFISRRGAKKHEFDEKGYLLKKGKGAFVMRLTITLQTQAIYTYGDPLSLWQAVFPGQYDVENREDPLVDLAAVNRERVLVASAPDIESDEHSDDDAWTAPRACVPAVANTFLLDGLTIPIVDACNFPENDIDAFELLDMVVVPPRAL